MSLKRGLKILLAGCSIPAGHSAAVPIFAGPAYYGLGTPGYIGGNPPVQPGSTAGNGVAVGYATKYTPNPNTTIGVRALRWSVSNPTPVELGGIGTSASGNAYVFATSSQGDAVGDLNNQAVLWPASTSTPTMLGNLGASIGGAYSSFAFATNDNGLIVGSASKYVSGVNKGQRAVRWNAATGEATELASLGENGVNETSAAAYAVNALGDAVGWTRKYVGGVQQGQVAARWTGSGSAISELASLGTSSSGTNEATAYAINSNGDAVGQSRRYISGVQKGLRAVLWKAGSSSALELTDIGQTSQQVTTSNAYAINSSGTVAGSAQKIVSGLNRGIRAVRWDTNGNVTELGTLGQDSSSRSNGISYDVNDAGIIVGALEEYSETNLLLGKQAVFWTRDDLPHKLIDLIDPGLGWQSLSEARSISETNWVTGIGLFDPDGPGGQDAYDRMFLMQVQVPEPGSILCSISLAFTTLACERRRFNYR
jgi:hypothetical protein